MPARRGHETPDCSAADATSAGGHWNPTGDEHGSHEAGGAHHRGDVGNLEVGPDGTGSLRLTTDQWTLDGNPETSVVGRAVVVHASPDDFVSQPVGNAGARIGCGAVQRLGAGEPVPGPGPGTSGGGSRVASSTLWPRSGSSASGTARFTEAGGKVTLEVSVTGATPGEHGLHLHQTGDCSAPDGTSAGGHWNPDGHDHGDPSAEHHHAGDLGNITIAEDGTGTLRFETTDWVVDAPLVDGTRQVKDVVGRALILHANRDDLTSQPVGNAGGRIACGVIGVEAAAPTSAMARIDARGNSTLSGTAVFTRGPEGVTLKMDLSDVPRAGLHGAHLHAKPDCSSFDATSAAGHWNPGDHLHGAPDGGVSHLGDLGNIVVGADGRSSVVFSNPAWEVLGEHGVVGHAVIIHAGVDDGLSQPAGDAGSRIGCGVITLDGQQPKAPRRQQVLLEPKSGTASTGRVLLVEAGDAVTLELEVQNVTPGQHGVHLHETPDCSAPDAASAGAHWNPTGAPHGAPGDGSHVGDLGNIVVDANGRGRLTLSSKRWYLGGAGVTPPTAADGGVRYDVLGRALVVNTGADDLTSQPAGNAGGRVACGVLK